MEERKKAAAYKELVENVELTKGILLECDMDFIKKYLFISYKIHKKKIIKPLLWFDGSKLIVPTSVWSGGHGVRVVMCSHFRFPFGPPDNVGPDQFGPTDRVRLMCSLLYRKAMLPAWGITNIALDEPGWGLQLYSQFQYSCCSYCSIATSYNFYVR